jgi:hypothetical protein
MTHHLIDRVEGISQIAFLILFYTPFPPNMTFHAQFRAITKTAIGACAVS